MQKHIQKGRGTHQVHGVSGLCPCSNSGRKRSTEFPSGEGRRRVNKKLDYSLTTRASTLFPTKSWYPRGKLTRGWAVQRRVTEHCASEHSETNHAEKCRLKVLPVSILLQLPETFELTHRKTGSLRLLPSAQLLEYYSLLV